MNKTDMLSWLLAAGSLTGGQFVINKKRIGYLIWIFINILWVMVFCQKGIYASAFLFGVYLLQAVYGFIKWKDKIIDLSTVNAKTTKVTDNNTSKAIQ